MKKTKTLTTQGTHRHGGIFPVDELQNLDEGKDCEECAVDARLNADDHRVFMHSKNPVLSKAYADRLKMQQEQQQQEQEQQQQQQQQQVLHPHQSKPQNANFFAGTSTA